MGAARRPSNAGWGPANSPPDFVMTEFRQFLEPPTGGFLLISFAKMGSAVQVGPPAGWEPLLSSAIQELSVARLLSCSVSGLARFSLPQAPSGQGLRLASGGHTRVTWAEHRHSAVQPWHPMEPTHSAPPPSLLEAGVTERCPPAPDNIITRECNRPTLIRRRSTVRDALAVLGTRKKDGEGGVRTHVPEETTT